MDAAIVTGASRGLGRYLAEALLSPSRIVIAVSRAPAPELAEIAARRNTRLVTIQADLSEAGAANRVMAVAFTALMEMQPKQLILINNAGQLGPMAFAGDFDSDDETAKALSLNLIAPIQLTNAFLQRAKAKGATDLRIAQMSSGAAIRTYPGWSVYGATKAGLDHFTRIASLEQSGRTNGAKIVSIYPGVIDTDMQASIRASDPKRFPLQPGFEALHKQGNLASPQSVAGQVVAYLLSPQFGDEPVVDIRDLLN